MKYILPGMLTVLFFINPVIASANASDARMVAFFPVESEVCPTGWSEYKPAKGYLIRGTDNTKLIGTRKGDAIADAKAPLHRHKIQADLPLAREAVGLISGPHGRVDNSKVNVDGWSDTSDGAMPYIQYLICQEDVPKAGEPSKSIFLPRNTVQWFTGGSCPTGWALYEPLIGNKGRTALPLPRDAVATSVAAVVDEDPDWVNHAHKLFFNMPGKENNISLEVNHTDDPYFSNPFHKTDIAKSSLREIERLSNDAVRTDVPAKAFKILMPYVYLRPCHKESNTVNVAELPAGMGVFAKSFSCPTGLYNVASSPGRFLVGLPEQKPGSEKPLSGTAFGAEPLKSEGKPEHLHRVDISVSLNTWDMDTSTFLPHRDHLKGLSKGSSKVEGKTEYASMIFSYVQLKFCKVQE